MYRGQRFDQAAHDYLEWIADGQNDLREDVKFSARYWLARTATRLPWLATALGVPEGALVLEVDTVVYLHGGRPAACRTVCGTDWDRLAKLRASLLP
jgi:hypothetical protein